MNGRRDTKSNLLFMVGDLPGLKEGVIFITEEHMIDAGESAIICMV